VCIAAAIIGGAIIGAAGVAIAGGEAASATKDAASKCFVNLNSMHSPAEQLAAPYTGLGQTRFANTKLFLDYAQGKGVRGRVPPRARVLSREGHRFRRHSRAWPELPVPPNNRGGSNEGAGRRECLLNRLPLPGKYPGAGGTLPRNRLSLGP